MSENQILPRPAKSSSLPALIDLLHMPGGQTVPLPERLVQFYGELRFREHPGRPYVITNFVASIDGVVSLSVPGRSGGGDISGYFPADQALMGILRACADVVIAGAAQLRRPPGTVWLPETIYPDFALEYAELRQKLAKPAAPLQAIVTGTGDIDLHLPIFTQQAAPVLILTSQAGQAALEQQELPKSVEVRVLSQTGRLEASQIIKELETRFTDGLYLVEGGPHLVRYFIEEHCLDELFLTVAPQIAGRDTTPPRPGFTAGKNFAPDDSRWCELSGVKRLDDYLFLRYVVLNGYTNIKS